MKAFLLSITIFIAVQLTAMGQDSLYRGRVTNAATGIPLQGTTVLIKGSTAAAFTDSTGHFVLPAGTRAPFTISVTSIGYWQLELSVKHHSFINILLEHKNEMMNEVVVAATRREEKLIQSPISIDKMDNRAIRQTASVNFYEGLQNYKGVEMIASGLNLRQINTRGFNSPGNARFLQLIDGVDNQPPGTNFALGNTFGPSDLDIESVEIIPGASAALYGPVAFNGVLAMRTKDPYEYPGLSVQIKSGINHVGDKNTGAQGLYDLAMRYAGPLGKRFAIKLNAAYFTGQDWFADNYNDVDVLTPADKRGNSNPARNALNIYGDEISKTITGIGRVSRTGYEEKDLMDYQVYNTRLNGAIYYKLNSNNTLSYQFNLGQATISQTGSNRSSLNDYLVTQHKLELKGKQYFVRAYAVIEDAGHSYNSRKLAQGINLTWVRDLTGNPVTIAQANETWFTRYEAAFKGNVNGVTANDHTIARSFADQGRYLPGSTDFEREKNRLSHLDGPEGARIFSESKFYHAEGQYDFSNIFKFAQVIAGGNFRTYQMFTNGSLFDDKNGDIVIHEGGVFIQASRKFFHNKLNILASDRYDKNQNFKGRMTPRIAAALEFSKNHFLRASFQTGFRSPVPAEQFYKSNTGTFTILGGAPANSEGMNVYENSYTFTSVDSFGVAVNRAIGQGATREEAVEQNKNKLQQANVKYIAPEQVRTFEVGYRSTIGDKLYIDASYYHNDYTNFIISSRMVRPNSPVKDASGNINTAAATDLLNRNSHIFVVFTNGNDKVSSQGAVLEARYLLGSKITVGAHGTWAEFNMRNANPNNIPAFNTPKFRTAVTAGGENIWKHAGFNLAWRWQESYDWSGTLNDNRPGRIGAYSTLDAQINYQLIKQKTNIKLGANNLMNYYASQGYGLPAIGGVYYISFTFDALTR
ncbi:TonB-dependent receptor [uncultured Chitinophaga sp.]|uniref:TonB-dependent receptor n=1 Tax=uncultured Chitinophaga sp. TaxID=339340 RepID=UPI0025CB8584|nr:TonB-dependent receptor [uncultured Chitinophaga sp.]